MKMREVTHIFRPLYITVKVILAKYGLGYILGEFLTNPTGHPAYESSLLVFLSISLPISCMYDKKLKESELHSYRFLNPF
jgi:hypothetical protein